ncbi:MAG: DNA double-strand break repair nuclease NurA [Candidatus Kariarchaeaceae archaeon]|jgi:hypothetical protein
MFDDLSRVVKAEREKRLIQNQWMEQFHARMDELRPLPEPWMEEHFIQDINPTVTPITKIGGVDGGLISEAMSGFDIILYRAVGAVFQGIGEKVRAHYIPNFDPDPQLFFAPALESRYEFNTLSTLLRLYIEYKVALETIEKENPTVLFIDGKVSPMWSDFASNLRSESVIVDIEHDVKTIYKELVSTAISNEVLLCGIIKDSRSRELVRKVMDHIPKWVRANNIDPKSIKGWRKILPQMIDQTFSSSLLKVNQRTAWMQSSIPDWLPRNPRIGIRSCLVRPLQEDTPIRLEIVHQDLNWMNHAISIALGSLVVLAKHGMPIAIPTVILEADDRARLSAVHLENTIDQISLELGIPKHQLRKRRVFRESLERI